MEYKTTMTKYERAQQLWSILVLAARNRQVLTYGMIEKATGLVRPSIGQMLSPIQNYCLNRKLPPLTILVVKDKSGMPGDGFIAAADIPKAQQDVFAYDWFDWGCPQTPELEKYDK
ncbi:MAG: hypothetical protein AAB370_02335 [Verrucomicrobiota bacterium]